jgi:hypothetical protein
VARQAVDQGIYIRPVALSPVKRVSENLSDDLIVLRALTGDRSVCAMGRGCKSSQLLGRRHRDRGGRNDVALART